MTTKETDSFISTDAKVLINDWQTLRNLIVTHTQLTTQQAPPSESSALTTLLSERQLTDALTGPYQQFFKQTLSAYAAITKLQLELNLQGDDTLKIKADDEQETNAALKELIGKYSLSDVNKMQSDLDQLTNDHNEQWHAQLTQWHQPLLNSLTTHKIPLTDIEIKELQDNEPISELIGRFKDRNFDLPLLNFSDFSFEHYLQLKLELAIRSSLNRRHEAHDSADITRILKKFRVDFTQIKQQEKALLDKQKTATKEIVKAIKFCS